VGDEQRTMVRLPRGVLRRIGKKKGTEKKVKNYRIKREKAVREKPWKGGKKVDVQILHQGKILWGEGGGGTKESRTRH